MVETGFGIGVRSGPMSENARYLRFTLSDRWEHWVQAVSFTVLAITGLVQKFVCWIKL